eukprot:Filipodium_phascolosomae@DN3904_c0_g1_i1.p1
MKTRKLRDFGCNVVILSADFTEMAEKHAQREFPNDSYHQKEMIKKIGTLLLARNEAEMRRGKATVLISKQVIIVTTDYYRFAIGIASPNSNTGSTREGLVQPLAFRHRLHGDSVKSHKAQSCFP